MLIDRRSANNFAFTIFFGIVCIFFLLPTSTLAQNASNYLSFSSTEDLYKYFELNSSVKSMPLIQGHRGTRESNYPEGTIPCFEFLLKNTKASIEIDPRLTKDSVVVVFHDAVLDRYTDGKGKVNDYTWEELQQFNLKNPKGELTSFKIPLLADILDWARDKTVLVLDRKDVPPAIIAKLIKEKNASKYTMNTVWSLNDAITYFKYDPTRMFLISIRSEETIKDYIEAGIPANQLIKSLGTRWDNRAEQIFEETRFYGVSSLIATASSYDKQQDKDDRANDYRMLSDKGINIIESDRPIEVKKALNY